MSSADDQYEQKNDATGGDVPAGDSMDNDYKSRSGQYQIPVQKDDAPVHDPIDPANADSDETLGKLSSHYLFAYRIMLTFTQRKMMPMRLIKAISSAVVPGVQSLVVVMLSLVTRRVFHPLMGHLPLVKQTDVTIPYRPPRRCDIGSVLYVQ